MRIKNLSLLSALTLVLTGGACVVPASSVRADPAVEVQDNQEDLINNNLEAGMLGRSAYDPFVTKDKKNNIDHISKTDPETNVYTLGSQLGSSGGIGKDRAALTAQQMYDALAKSVLSPVSESAGASDSGMSDDVDALCKLGFLPVNKGDDEGSLTVSKSVCSTTSDYARYDRSVESLLGPLQYIAPRAMRVPGRSAAVEGQSSEAGTSTKPFLRFVDKPADAYYPIYSAWAFCQNVTHTAFAHVESASTTDVKSVLSKIIKQESLDSKLTANCWHFFEERVQYPEGVGLHDAQVARCRDDYMYRHIITQTQWEDCQKNGRSNLKARYDMAHRVESTQYAERFLQYLGAVPRAVLIGIIEGEPERFEQTLLMERQIMTSALAAARVEPVTYGKQSFELK